MLQLCGGVLQLTKNELNIEKNHFWSLYLEKITTCSLLPLRI